MRACRSFTLSFLLLGLSPNLNAALLTVVRPAPAGSAEGITFDSTSGNYVVTYEAEDESRPGGLYQTILIPATKIDPVVHSNISLAPRDTITYSYRVGNGKLSKQNIEMFSIIATNIRNGISAGEGWEGSMLPNFKGPGLKIWWSYKGDEDQGGLMPGRQLQNLSFESNDLPGIGAMDFIGATPIPAYAGDGPNQEIADQISELDKKNFVPRAVAVPVISISSPFEAAGVLSAVRQHVDKDLVSMKLVDPTLASQLDRLFTAAIEAAKINNTTALKSNLKDIRHLLRKEHGDVESDDDDTKANSKPRLIDKLAARVIDFDVRYVLKRLEKTIEDSQVSTSANP